MNVSRLSLLPTLLLLVTGSCSPQKQPSSSSRGEPGVVQVTTRGLTFEAPEKIPSGWVTFRFTNATAMVHFGLLERMPKGIGIDEQQKQVAPIFQDGMDLLNAGKPEAAQAKFGELPEWFGHVVFTGGPGLTSPGRTCEATVRLEPGTYLMECYVKSSGVFHSFNPNPQAYGMVHQFTVTAAASDEPEPKANLEITISGKEGIEVQGEPAPGPQTVAVHFQDQMVHENFVGHDVHLAKLADDTDLGALAAWMDWTQTNGLQVPAPVEFLGGLEEMPAGETGYFTVTLEPGRYAWIAEVPHADKKGMLKTFAVPAPQSGS